MYCAQNVDEWPFLSHMKTFEHSCYLCVVDQQFAAFLSDFMTAVAYLLWLLEH